MTRVLKLLGNVILLAGLGVFVMLVAKGAELGLIPGAVLLFSTVFVSCILLSLAEFLETHKAISVSTAEIAKALTDKASSNADFIN